MSFGTRLCRSEAASHQRPMAQTGRASPGARFKPPRRSIVIYLLSGESTQLSRGRLLIQSRRTEARPECRAVHRSEEHTSELQSLMRISYDVFCLKKNTTRT